MFLRLKQAMGSMKWYKSRKSVTCFGCGAWCAIFHPKMGLCQKIFKALLAGLTNQRDISDSFPVTPLTSSSLAPRRLLACIEFYLLWLNLNVTTSSGGVLNLKLAAGLFKPYWTFNLCEGLFVGRNHQKYAPATTTTTVCLYVMEFLERAGSVQLLFRLLVFT